MIFGIIGVAGLLVFLLVIALMVRLLKDEPVQEQWLVDVGFIRDVDCYCIPVLNDDHAVEVKYYDGDYCALYVFNRHICNDPTKLDVWYVLRALQLQETPFD